VIGWEDYTLMISFVSVGFPTNTRSKSYLLYWFIVWMNSQHVTLSTFSLTWLF